MLVETARDSSSRPEKPAVTRHEMGFVNGVRQLRDSSSMPEKPVR